MTALRLISLPVHGALEMLVGLTTMAAPFLFGFTPAAAIIGVSVGALLVGLSLASIAPDGVGRHPLSVASHYTFDFGLAGDRAAALYFGIAALAQLALNLTTRYSLRG